MTPEDVFIGTLQEVRQLTAALADHPIAKDHAAADELREAIPHFDAAITDIKEARDADAD